MELPLFPLSTVLFPGMTLPIHVFEKRYLLMIRRCLEQKRPFGVVLIKRGSEEGEPPTPFAVGTIASIAHVEQLPEERMNVVVLGQKRFHIDQFVQRRPYLVGRVEPLTSYVKDQMAARQLADTIAALFAEYYRLHLAISNQWARRIGVPGDADSLSDFVASRLSVETGTKQKLLETLSVVRRLEREEEILGQEIRELTLRLKAIQRQKYTSLGVVN